VEVDGLAVLLDILGPGAEEVGRGVALDDVGLDRLGRR
jgi:hypothetical protein